jgi:hypothetical protein
MENQRVTWEQIKTSYNQEWIELVDYIWPDGEMYPLEGVIRSHGANKKEFHLQCRKDPMPLDSAILFVGPPVSKDGALFSPSLIRFE